MLTASALLLGQTRDPAMAKYLASRFYRYDPHRVRKREPVQGVIQNAVQFGGFMGSMQPALHGTTHYRTTEYTIEEQITLNSEVFLTLKRFHFLAGLAQREGELPTTLAPVTIAPMDAGLFVDKEKTTRLRAKLTARDGTPEEAVHQEISERRDRCVCLVRPAFHDLLHPSQEAYHPHPTAGTRQPPMTTPAGAATPPTAAGTDGGAAGGRARGNPAQSPPRPKRSPEPAGAGRSPEPSGADRSWTASPPVTGISRRPGR